MLTSKYFILLTIGLVLVAAGIISATLQDDQTVPVIQVQEEVSVEQRLAKIESELNTFHALASYVGKAVLTTELHDCEFLHTQRETFIFRVLFCPQLHSQYRNASDIWVRVYPIEGEKWSWTVTQVNFPNKRSEYPDEHPLAKELPTISEEVQTGP